MIVLGLTGSIGMGKSTTAGFFRELGVPVWDADAAVHKLYSAGGPAVEPIARLFPDAVTDGAVDRTALRRQLGNDTNAISKLEQIVHPLVQKDRNAFIQHHQRMDTPLIVLDIPLLFETGAEKSCDFTLVVTTEAAEQRRRVLARPGMTEQDFIRLSARQMPDAEKRRRASYVIETRNKAQTKNDVRRLIQELTGK